MKLIAIIVLSVACRSFCADTNHWFRNAELTLTVEASFGHFTVYTPPLEGNILHLDLSRIGTIKGMQFAQGTAKYSGALGLRSSFELIEHHDLGPDITTVRYVSEGGTRLTLDIELFRNKARARAWIICDSSKNLTQGFAGLRGTLKEKTSDSNKVD